MVKSELSSCGGSAVLRQVNSIHKKGSEIFFQFFSMGKSGYKRKDGCMYKQA